ncbi:hypothetical protein L596_016095 [Steinernema carpocapsae]|uniref:Uncharacterized protein n=1 Tax=Steinernema carpocapsae TaxID=34508 RepID=A0A4U5NHS2_STECR|nr:hypothetical protein L596_016095 [Steinernema carpocapsae]
MLSTSPRKPKVPKENLLLADSSARARTAFRRQNPQIAQVAISNPAFSVLNRAESAMALADFSGIALGGRELKTK